MDHLAAACGATNLPLERSLRQTSNRPAPQPKRRRTPNERLLQTMDAKFLIPEKRPKSSMDGDGERVRVTVRLRPPTKAEQRDDEGPFIFLDTDRNTVVLRRTLENAVVYMNISAGMCMGFSVEVAFAIPFYLNQPLSMHVQSGRGSFEAFTEFQFDGVLPSGCQQVDVYNTAARPVVLDVLQGYNGTIMAYGQTGAGKTYTLSDKLACGGMSVEGIIPRSAAEIFARAEQDNDNEYHVSMSYIQIYMEQIQDLLRPESCNMQIREGETGVYVSGIQEVEVKSAEDVMKLLLLGDRNRAFSFTKLNAHSSRSHAIVILTVERKAKNFSEPASEASDRPHSGSSAGFLEGERVLVGKLFLVDLAGSERLKKSGSEGIRASEAMSVNLSLTCLGKCIGARADPNATHVPFRDSKLTRLLQESLGGNAKTSLIINIAPCNDYLRESLSSLSFGSRAMKVATRAIVNVEEEFRVLTKNLQDTLEMQDERLQSLEASILSKEEQLVQARRSLEERTKQVEMLRKEQNSFNEKFMEQLRLKDDHWSHRLEIVRNAAVDSQRKRIRYLQEELEKLKEVDGQQGTTIAVLSNDLAKVLCNPDLHSDYAARVIQRSYRRRYLLKLQRVTT
ncbi:hypothetical protein AXG93_645s1000 [Marchantia polymorpha subsp. ruderalis]|uniref:Kinesin-like protein n=1 Tax=Marchantia polymorpha subsp. ruderalis TaxID=1480154 RepID=A0A176WR88_MARPO|nr:hypothetical protein AXG93_645s1000 [Marchantia polymorpha subsp. ruderalis]